MGNTNIVQDLERSLRDEHSSGLPREIVDLRPSNEDDELNVKELLRQLVVHTVGVKRFDGHAEYRFKDINQLYLEARESACPTYVLEVLNYLRLYQVLAAGIRPLIEDPYEVWFGSSAVSRSAKQFIDAIEAIDAFDQTALSSRLILGKLHALDNRVKAASIFAEAKPALDEHIHVFLGEIGINTYFDQKALLRNETLIVERRASLPKRNQPTPLCCDTDTRFLVVMSCDQRFMQIYLPYWLTVAGYLRTQGLAFHFILTAESEDEAAQMANEADILLCNLAIFRDYDPTQAWRNVSFSSAAKPAWCPRLRTFAASARFLYAREISELSEVPILIQDIDFELTADPEPWFNALPLDRIAMTASCIGLSIDPWQKFRGGAFMLPPLAQALTLMQRLEGYLLLGLGEQESWFLDQNALGFLYEAAITEGLQEGAEGVLFSLDELRPLLRPMGERPGLHPAWEQRHDRMLAAH